MEIDTTNFKTVAIPLLKEMAGQFPNAIDVTPSDELNEDAITLHRSVIRFLVNEEFVKQSFSASSMALTAKGLELFGCNIADEIRFAMQRPTTIDI